jgi:osmotically-inducible protein OsmY
VTAAFEPDADQAGSAGGRRYLVWKREEQVSVGADASLKRSLETELRHWMDVGALTIKVDEGTVAIAGSVERYPQKRAIELAALRAGARGAAIEIEVRQPCSDRDLEQAAADTLRWNPLIPRERVQVAVECGHLTLSGTVHHGYQRNAAESAVRGLTAAIDVHNLLEVVSDV